MSLPGLLAQHAYAAASRQRTEELEDRRRWKFLVALGNGRERVPGLVLSDWEDHFLANQVQRKSLIPAGCLIQFTARERTAIDAMQRRYAGRLPAPQRPTLPQLPPADPGCCEYAVRNEDGRRVRCNVKAAWTTPLGKRLCQEHHDLREKMKQPLRSRYL